MGVSENAFSLILSQTGYINHVHANSVSPGTETKVRMENFLEEVPQNNVYE